MKIIITDCDHASMEQEETVFKKNNLDFTLLQCKTEEDLIAQCKGGEVFANQYAPFTRKVIEALSPEIKHIVRYGVGVNNVDLQAATEFGVQVSNVPDYGMNEVADQALAMMMDLLRKTSLMNAYTKTQKWDYTKSIPVYRIPGKTIGVIGLGRIGKTFVKRLSGFDVNVIGYDEYLPADAKIEGVKLVDFKTLVAESDAISIHCPLTEETRDLFDLEVFKQMKDTAYLINVSRGGIVNEADLATALEQKLIAGAALDVVDTEPMNVGSPLFEYENFICTPHMAWYSEESALELKRKVAEEAARFALGETVLYPVNKV